MARWARGIFFAKPAGNWHILVADMPRSRARAWLCRTLILAGVLLVWYHPLRLQAAPASNEEAGQTAILNKYCVSCHSQNLKRGGIVLEKLNRSDGDAKAELFEKVIRKVRSGEMPPPGLPRPDKVPLEAFVVSLENDLDRAAVERPHPGRSPLHRLNRTEYGNAVRDVLGLEIDPRTLLSADGVDQHGFDNTASILTVSPALLEQYVSAARKVSRLAVGDTHQVPVFETYTVPGTLLQDERMSDNLPFGSRGGITVRHYFPVEGEYEIKIRLKRQLYGYILGMGREHHLEVSLNGKPIRSFTVGGNAPSHPSPNTFSGSIMGDPRWDLYMHEADAGLVTRIQARAGSSVVGVWFAKDLAEPEEIPQPRETGFGLAINEYYDGNPAVENVAVGGPYRIDGPGDTPSRRRIFSCHPASATDELSCADKIISSLAQRAYRRPLTTGELAILLDFYRQGARSQTNAQGTFEGGIQLAIERILSDPNFLFRVEREPGDAKAGAVYRLSDLELASRLSFFLWSSVPDDELLNVAIRGKLSEPAAFGAQVRRMLGDQRTKALVDNFVSAWLDLTKVRSTLPDPDIYSDFDDNLREAFLKETALFAESQLRADRPVLDLITANYTFLNERLARHYGIPNVYGSHFRRVQIQDPARGGLIGQGSILLATSYPNRTSPVLRGKWVLDNMLGSPPPPPPPDVPALKDNDPYGKPASVRERLEEHRRNPACAVCHVRMDPLGFALENFDGIGKWRTDSDGAVINAAASLPDGTKFEGVAGLRDILVSRREQFVNTFITKMMIYALGREVDYHDAPAIRGIARDAKAGDYRWSSVILALSKSTPFRMSMVKENGSAVTAALKPSGEHPGQKGK